MKADYLRGNLRGKDEEKEFFHAEAQRKAKRRKGEEKVDAPSATIFHGFRLPSLRDCAGMTGGGGDNSIENMLFVRARRPYHRLNPDDVCFLCAIQVNYILFVGGNFTPHPALSLQRGEGSREDKYP